jgi:phospholipase/carboxylesterase
MRWGLVLVLMLGGCVRSQAPAPAPPLVSATVPPRVTGEGRAPVLVLLHGLGANEHDLLGLEADLDPRFELVALRAPNQVGPDRYGWFETRFTPQGPVHDPGGAEASRLKVVESLQALRSRTDRLYLLGFSQGAILSLSIALTEPGLVDGVIAISGRTLDEVSARSKVHGGGPKVLVMHGTRDTVLPFSNAVATRASLEAHGLTFELLSFDAGHEINGPMRAAEGLDHRRVGALT